MEKEQPKRNEKLYEGRRGKFMAAGRCKRQRLWVTLSWTWLKLVGEAFRQKVLTDRIDVSRRVRQAHLSASRPSHATYLHVDRKIWHGMQVERKSLTRSLTDTKRWSSRLSASFRSSGMSFREANGYGLELAQIQIKDSISIRCSRLFEIRRINLHKSWWSSRHIWSRNPLSMNLLN